VLYDSAEVGDALDLNEGVERQGLHGEGGARGGGGGEALAVNQGLTLVHFSAQLEPCLTQEITLHTLHTPYHTLDTGCTAPPRTPYAIQSAQVELKTGRV